ncbi:hypothetical protein [Paenibacillus sp.]|uniref:hypothetical protein n=1 Tax=Paenibacillus sp. TaxID=58172 RepID=UPI002D561475|nr:hypothetical protein [Paenibacillus sp.]HZG83823.1 hypothetical protein [Paenibacillus sp.]
MSNKDKATPAPAAEKKGFRFGADPKRKAVGQRREEIAQTGAEPTLADIYAAQLVIIDQNNKILSKLNRM